MTRRTNARLAGFLFLFYIVVVVTQMVLPGGTSGAEDTAARLAAIARNAPLERINILLTLLTSVIAMTLAMALHGLTRDVDRDLAVLALFLRMGEGLLAAVTPMISLGLLWLAAVGAGPGAPEPAGANALGAFLLKLGGWNTGVCSLLFAEGSTLFCWLFLRGRLIPAPLAWLGLAASILMVAGLPLRLVGWLHGPVAMWMWLPMAAFEIPLGLLLLIKGVREPAAA
jgi:hypothetical protein